MHRLFVGALFICTLYSKGYHTLLKKSAMQADFSFLYKIYYTRRNGIENLCRFTENNITVLSVVTSIGMKYNPCILPL